MLAIPPLVKEKIHEASAEFTGNPTSKLMSCRMINQQTEYENQTCSNQHCRNIFGREMFELQVQIDYE